MSEAELAKQTQRVKVYSYSESGSWDDMGTGHVCVDFMERNNASTIIVRSEEDGSVLLESKIVQDRAYQKREETLIVWTEDESCDLAVSFQEKAGCDHMWEEICEIQGRNPELSVTGSLSDDGGSSELFDESTKTPELPPCSLANLQEILEVIEQAATKTNIAPGNLPVVRNALERDGYIPKLLELFHVCEDLDNKQGLITLQRIFSGLILVSNNDLLQILIQDDHIYDVIGCLEYNAGQVHVRHRDIVDKLGKRTELIPFSDKQLLPKIHKTYQVQYIRDVLLPPTSLFEEHKFAVVNSYILLNKTEIVKVIMADSTFINTLFNELLSEETTVERYRELAELLKEVNGLAALAPEEFRSEFNVLLIHSGLLKALEGMLSSEDSVVAPLGVDVLISLCEFDCSVIWNHILDTDDNPEDSQLLNIVISLLVDGEFADIDVQLVALIQSIIVGNPPVPSPATIAYIPPVTNNSADFLFRKYFYNRCMHRLVAPLMAQTASDKISKDTMSNAVLLSHILDILSECLDIHSYHIRNYIIDKNLLARVLVLMTSSHGHLVLSALRFCRRVVSLKEECYNRYIIRNNLFSPIVKKFMSNGQRYNLINSAIIEVFNFITKANIKSLIKYSVDNFMGTLDSVEYVDTFKHLKLAYEQEKDRQELQEQETTPSIKGGIIHVNRSRETQRWRRDQRDLDEDEEAWFDEEVESVVTSTPTAPVSTAPVRPFTQVSYSPRPNDEGRAPPGCYSNPPSSPEAKTKVSSPVLSSSALLTLAADYDEDSDEEQDQLDTSQPKRPKL